MFQIGFQIGSQIEIEIEIGIQIGIEIACVGPYCCNAQSPGGRGYQAKEDSAPYACEDPDFDPDFDFEEKSSLS